jgi:hypothetical protein
MLPSAEFGTVVVIGEDAMFKGAAGEALVEVPLSPRLLLDMSKAIL